MVEQEKNGWWIPHDQSDYLDADSHSIISYATRQYVHFVADPKQVGVHDNTDWLVITQRY